MTVSEPDMLSERLVGSYKQIWAQMNLTNVVLALLAIVVLRCFSRYRQGMKAVAGIPGFRTPFFPLGFPGAIFPTSWWNPGYYFTWQWRSTNYTRFGNDTFSVVSYVTGPHALYTATLEVARQVIGGGHKTSFVKPGHFHRTLLYWGMNLVASDKEVWRRHRRIVGPAFNNDLYTMVWAETLQTYRDMTAAEQWDGKKEIEVPVLQKITFKLALLIIGKCGFGFNFNWFDPPRTANGTLSLQETLRIVVDSNIQAILLPKWIRKLPFRPLRESLQAFDQMAKFMDGQVAQRRADTRSRDTKELGKDVFTLLIQANETESQKLKLSNEELIGNVFVLIFAGHETTAHTLAVTLGLLSLYPDIQDEVYQQISSVFGNEEPKLEDCNKLDKLLAVFYETLRLFPSGHLLIREAWEDTVLQVPNPVGQEGSTSFPIPKGTHIVVDMVGLHYNPRYFPDPFEFKPSRWEGVGIDSEAFTAFSIGPRACVGRKFATVESLCFLACILRDFEVQPLLEPGESKQQWREKVMKATFGITLGVKDVPLKFVRRS